MPSATITCAYWMASNRFVRSNRQTSDSQRTSCVVREWNVDHELTETTITQLLDPVTNNGAEETVRGVDPGRCSHRTRNFGVIWHVNPIIGSIQLDGLSNLAASESSTIFGLSIGALCSVGVSIKGQVNYQTFRNSRNSARRPPHSY